MKIVNPVTTKLPSRRHRAVGDYVASQALVRCLLGLLFLTGFRGWGQQPVISDFSPKAGAPFDTITVSGSGFSVGTMRVYFWRGVPAAGVTVRSGSLMDVRVPSGATTGPLGIQRDFGTTNYTSLDFVRIDSGPFITGFSPIYGPISQLVVITGVHFGGLAPNGVLFNGIRATDASVNSDGTYISVHVPFGATTGPITVSTPLGTSNSVAPFTVLGPGPYVTGFNPTYGTAGTTVLIDGVQFSSVTNVAFNGVRGANIFIQSDTLIRADAPAGVTTGPITVSSPLGSSSMSNFFVPPAITNISPAAGRSGTNVTIKGVNFRGAIGVSFNGIAAAYSVVDNNTIQATVPPSATTGTIRVTTPPYSCFSPGNFAIQPTVSGFSPAAGPVGTSVVITGANLNAGTPVVRFNGVQAAAPTGVGFGQLTAVVPSGATTGRISVTTADGSDTNATDFFLPATITSFSPTNSAPGTAVNITGQNFLGATQVLFNGAPAAGVTVNSNNSISATVPEGVTTGPLKVTTPAGTVTSSGLFYGVPVISGFTPSSGLPGTNVTISGTNFLGAKAVRFNGIGGAINSVENGRIVAVVPSSAVTGPITVEAPAGTNTSQASFVINYTSDVEVWMTASTNVVIIGSNLVYSVTMVNRGPFVATNVRWTNDFPATVIDSVTLGEPWTLNTHGTTVVATNSSVIAGGTATMVVRVRTQTAGDTVAISTISSDSPDPVPGNNSVSLSTWVEPLAVLTIHRLSNQVRVAWPLLLSNYLLEGTLNLNAANGWTEMTNVPSVSGTQQFILDTNGLPMKFYRLKK